MNTPAHKPGSGRALRVAVVTETYPPEINGVARTVDLGATLGALVARGFLAL